MKLRWDDVADVLSLLVETGRADWRVAAPPYEEALPSAELEMAVDAWCRILVRDLRAPIQPPPEVARWMLARMASVCAALSVKPPTDPPPKFDHNLFAQLLIDEWHGALRNHWQIIGRERRRARIKRRAVWVILGVVAAILLAGLVFQALR